jgi:uncharacterized membrane protein YhhN
MTVVNCAEGDVKKFLIAALLASGIGDVMLALTINNAFIYGLGSFLIAQLVYTVTLIKCRRSTSLSILQKSSMVLVAVYAITMGFYILPHTGDMLIPVSVYLIVIGAMGISAIASGLNGWVILGALSFIASDSLLAIGLFRQPIIYSSYLVMITYYFAQYGLLTGLLKTTGK